MCFVGFRGSDSPNPVQLNGQIAMVPTTPLHIGTLNIRNSQARNLESTLKQMQKMHINMAVLTETKMTTGKHTTYRFGYSMCMSEAWSSSQGGVAVVFNKTDDHFDVTMFWRWGPNVISILLTSGQRRRLIVGVYISPTARKQVYKATIEDLYKAAAVAEQEQVEMVVLGDINVDLQGFTNSRLDIQQGALQQHDDRRSSMISALSSLGLKDTGKRFLQRQQTGVWTWGQVGRGRRVRSVCDYILMEPSSPVLTHHIRWVQGCSTDHRMVYVDIPTGDHHIHRKQKWRLQWWPIPTSGTNHLDLSFKAIQQLASEPKEVLLRPYADWISDKTWDLLVATSTLRHHRATSPSGWRRHYRYVKHKIAQSLQKDRNQRIVETLTEAEACVDHDPKRSFQLLSTWYK